MSFEIKENKIIIKEPLVDIESAFEFVKELNRLSQEGVESISIDMRNAHSLPSVVIGKLMVLKEKGIKIEIIITNSISYTLFEELGLTSLFDIKSI